MKSTKQILYDKKYYRNGEDRCEHIEDHFVTRVTDVNTLRIILSDL